MSLHWSSSSKFAEEVISSHEDGRGRTGRCSPVGFRNAYAEWAKFQNEVRIPLRYRDPFCCPACHDTPVAVMVDGNRKSFRWKWHRAGVIGEYYDNRTGFLLGPDAAVREHLAGVYGGVGGDLAPPDKCYS